METKPALYTTEFWLHLIGQTVFFLNTIGVWHYMPPRYSALVQAVIGAAWVLSRGWAKSGSKPDDNLAANFTLFPRKKDLRPVDLASQLAAVAGLLPPAVAASAVAASASGTRAVADTSGTTLTGRVAGDLVTQSTGQGHQLVTFPLEVDPVHPEAGGGTVRVVAWDDAGRQALRDLRSGAEAVVGGVLQPQRIDPSTGRPAASDLVATWVRGLASA